MPPPDPVLGDAWCVDDGGVTQIESTLVLVALLRGGTRVSATRTGRWGGGADGVRLLGGPVRVPGRGGGPVGRDVPAGGRAGRLGRGRSVGPGPLVGAGGDGRRRADGPGSRRWARDDRGRPGPHPGGGRPGRPARAAGWNRRCCSRSCPSEWQETIGSGDRPRRGRRPTPPTWSAPVGADFVVVGSIGPTAWRRRGRSTGSRLVDGVPPAGSGSRRSIGGRRRVPA